MDLAAGFITVKIAKTGETVDIPVFPMLREELERARATTGGKGHCFPAAAEMYRNNPDGITWRVKQVLAKALETAPQTHALPVETAETVRAKGFAYIDRLGATSKAEKLRAVFTAYLDGHLLDAGCLEIVQPDQVPENLRWVRAWDPAAVSRETSKSGDPDFTAGAKCAVDSEGNFWIGDLVKWQHGWPRSRDRIKAIAVTELIPVYFEAQAAFKAAADNLREVMPPNILVRTVEVSRDKVSRCNQWLALAEHGKVRLVAGSWVPGFLEAVEQFDGSGSYHDDEIDAASIGYEACASSTFDWAAFCAQDWQWPRRRSNEERTCLA